MVSIQTLELEVEGLVDKDRQIDLRLRILVDLWFSRRCLLCLVRLRISLRTKLCLQLKGDLPQCGPVLRVNVFHVRREFQDVAFASATEALENTALQVRRKRRR